MGWFEARIPSQILYTQILESFVTFCHIGGPKKLCAVIFQISINPNVHQIAEKFEGDVWTPTKSSPKNHLSLGVWSCRAKSRPI